MHKKCRKFTRKSLNILGTRKFLGITSSLDVHSKNSFNKTCVRAAGNCRSGEVKACLTSIQEKLGSYESQDGDNDDQTLVNR